MSLHRSIVVSLALGASFVVGGPVVHAQESAEGGPPKLLVLRFAAEGGVDEGTAGSVEDITSAAFAATGRFSVLTGSDVEELMSLEAEKQAAGCEDTSCLAEIAGALGADYVVTGRISRLGALSLVKISLLEPAKARTVGQDTIQVQAIEDAAPRIRALSKKLTYLAFGEAVPAEVERELREATTEIAADAVEEEGGFPTYGTATAAFGCVGMIFGALGLVGAGLAVGAAVMVWQNKTMPGATKELTRDFVGEVAIASVVLGVVVGTVGVVLIPTGIVVGLFE